mmetsp:Transcript_21187/g.35525  ORF Transcript_21187/g.35525 Transcript_21187/m.35525 type:complete len:408 (+) Transcript_21187:126-1349(+)|eukprot:CAMPEP_0198210284 /NCGR_PEP_ID=MMETSP1445-20131203/20006_1 /TAXON_ID=36898 /ORGANISM="Pyramimonas sp., Strain CCMP2087" /LENGTH=407 /DNA_ID=CAMNT_0043884305 /DNA_START=96 /DNA_END=1319 /DNA_ORIENTATION=-
MIIRLRSRDGTERVEVPDNATVKVLKAKISTDLNIPQEQITLSIYQSLLMSKNPDAFTDLKDGTSTLRLLNVNHGSMVYMQYAVKRDVAPSVKCNTVPYGAHTNMAEMMAKWTRIEPQEKPHCLSCSFDAHAANLFQSYVRDTLGFSIQRCGFLYGECDEAGNVKVHFIYEPPQEGSPNSLLLMRNADEERRVDFIAHQLGFKQVGLVLTHSNAEDTDRDYNVSGKQLALMAEMQEAGGEHFVSAVVSLAESDEGEPYVHFELFQVSDQTVQLQADGLIAAQVEEDEEKQGTLKVTKEVIVAAKDTLDIDTDFLLVVVPILDHEGPLTCTFPVENRLISQRANDLRAHMSQNKGKEYCERLTDFHLLLYLSKQLDLTTDMALLVDAVRSKGTVAEGYQLIIDSIAGV